MSGFTDSIVGGIGSLIRQYIQSPNFVTGVSGWAIKKDGSAEFNNAIFRGTVVISNAAQAILIYNGTPANGNLVIAISNNGGTDAFGNVFLGGIFFNTYNEIVSWGSPAHPTVATLAGIRIHNDGTDDSLELIGETYGVAQSGNTLKIWATRADNSSLGFSFYSNATGAYQNNDFYFGKDALSGIGLGMSANNTGVDRFKFGPGVQGGYYSEEATPAAQVIVNNTIVILTNLVSVQKSTDYATPWNLTTGIWTCPVDSFYDLSAVIVCTSGVANTRNYAAWRGGIVAAAGKVYVATDYMAGGTSETIPCSGTRWITAGTTLHFEFGQFSGANRTIDTTNSGITIARRL